LGEIVACGNESASGLEMSDPRTLTTSAIVNCHLPSTLLGCPPCSEIKGLWSSPGDAGVRRNRKFEIGRRETALISDFLIPSYCEVKARSPASYSSGPQVVIGPRFGQHPQTPKLSRLTSRGRAADSKQASKQARCARPCCRW
jgi:hypothetical protein